MINIGWAAPSGAGFAYSAGQHFSLKNEAGRPGLGDDPPRRGATGADLVENVKVAPEKTNLPRDGCLTIMCSFNGTRESADGTA